MTELTVPQLEAFILKDVKASFPATTASSIQLFPGNAQCSAATNHVKLKTKRKATGSPDDETEPLPKKKKKKNPKQ